MNYGLDYACYWPKIYMREIVIRTGYQLRLDYHVVSPNMTREKGFISGQIEILHRNVSHFNSL